MDTAPTARTSLSRPAKWGVGLAIGALLLPVVSLVAFFIGIAVLIRGEIGPGLGIILLAPICAMLGYGFAVGLGIGV